MSTATDSQDVLRRHSVGTQAAVALDASLAAMALRAATRGKRLGPRARTAVGSILEKITLLDDYQRGGALAALVSPDRVARNAYEPVQVIARAASQVPSDPVAVAAGEDGSPLLSKLLAKRSSVVVNESGDVRIVKRTEALQLADILEELAQTVSAQAFLEDNGRVSKFAIG